MNIYTRVEKIFSTERRNNRWRRRIRTVSGSLLKVNSLDKVNGSVALEMLCTLGEDVSEDSGGVMRFVCSLGSVTSCCDSQGCGIWITLPAAEPETLLDLFCSPLRGRTFQADRFDLSSHLDARLEFYLLLLVGLVEKYRRKFVDLDSINFRSL